MFLGSFTANLPPVLCEILTRPHNSSRKESKHGFLGESLETLLSHKCTFIFFSSITKLKSRGRCRRLCSDVTLRCVTGGQALFRDFLKSEFCEENLDFWLACQEFRSTNSPEELRRRATSIYEEFVRANANQQVTSGGKPFATSKINVIFDPSYILCALNCD